MSFQKQNFFFFKIVFFSYMENACVRESTRTRDMGRACRHSSRNEHICT